LYIDIVTSRGCEASFLSFWKEPAAGMRFEVLAAVNVDWNVLRDVGYKASHPGEQQTFRSGNVWEHGFEENIIT